MSDYHQGRVDKSGNFRGVSRKTEGYLEYEQERLPFPALVTAWFPKSQTINVIRPTKNGEIVYEGVVIYGNFFEATGTIQGPKIVTKLKGDGFTTVRDKDQKDKTSSEYVLDNHIEALVCPMRVGDIIMYSSSNFRFLNADSPLLNNAKTGRKITRHDDGSVYIHDEDGNIQFKHPSGLDAKIGNSVDDIVLEEDFPPHEKNVTDYDSSVIVDLRIPGASGEHKVTFEAGKISILHETGSIFEYDDEGLLKITSSTSENLKTIINAINAEIQKIIVANGTGPDVGALGQLQDDLDKLLK